MSDPYKLTSEQVKEAPTTILERLRYLGPGFILSATIVGSGELIATTTLGAKAGFITFWVVIVSCLVKVAIQLEFGKYTILTGKTSMQILSELGGIKIRGSRWSAWAMLIFMTLKLFQVGGIVGGVAIILNLSLPGIATNNWTFAVAILAALLVFRGHYKHIERFSLLMIAFFTLFTFLSLYFLQFTSYGFGYEEVMMGLQFELPASAVAVAIGAFGITGVSGEEIIYYNYWCLEKGYARFTGPMQDTEEWRARARGWIKTMQLDAIVAMLIYTTVTALFYLLGASVLYAQGKIPEGYAMIETLSAIYTESLGPEVKVIYLIGAFVVLFSTLFAALASWTRLIPDIFSQLHWMDFYNANQRKKYMAWLSWILPFIWAILFIYIELPVVMILSGGIIGSFILFLIVYAVIDIRYWKVNVHFIPGIGYDVLLWLSIFSIFMVGIYGVGRLM